MTPVPKRTKVQRTRGQWSSCCREQQCPATTWPRFRRRRWLPPPDAVGVTLHFPSFASNIQATRPTKRHATKRNASNERRTKSRTNECWTQWLLACIAASHSATTTALDNAYIVSLAGRLAASYVLTHQWPHIESISHLCVVTHIARALPRYSRHVEGRVLRLDRFTDHLDRRRDDAAQLSMYRSIN